MKSAVLYEPRTKVVIERMDLSDPGFGEVLIKMMSSGVCHSDWHVVKGEWNHLPLPIILGHEGSGIVEAVGPNVQHVKVGDHVILSWRANCGACDMCMQGWPALCKDQEPLSQKPRVSKTGEEINPMAGVGTFSTYQVVPQAAAIPIDKDIPFPQASLVGCGVTTGVGAAINTASVQPGTTAAIFGAGGVGLNVIQGCQLAGATTIIAVDLLDSKLDLAMEFGATHTVNASQEDPVQKIIEICDGKGAHYAFEAIGLVEEPFIQSVKCTRSRGKSIWVGHAPFNTPVTIDARDLLQEKIIMGSMYGSAQPKITFSRILNLYKAGKLRLDELISRTYPLEEVNEAFVALGNGEVARSTLSFE
tara:strand:+ start:1278 stop:2360 length:1083 start_codon:yes stop_codon:yes gene_type:complete